MTIRGMIAALSMALAATTFAASETWAESPHALGLVATAEPAPMHCQDVLCTGLFRSHVLSLREASYSK